MTSLSWGLVLLLLTLGWESCYEIWETVDSNAVQALAGGSLSTLRTHTAFLAMACEWPETHLWLTSDWPLTGLKLAWDWPETDCTCEWPETGLRLAWDWPETGLRLAWDWPETVLFPTMSLHPDSDTPYKLVSQEHPHPLPGTETEIPLRHQTDKELHFLSSMMGQKGSKGPPA